MLGIMHHLAIQRYFHSSGQADNTVTMSRPDSYYVLVKFLVLISLITRSGTTRESRSREASMLERTLFRFVLWIGARMNPPGPTMAYVKKVCLVHNVITSQTWAYGHRREETEFPTYAGMRGAQDLT